MNREHVARIAWPGRVAGVLAAIAAVPLIAAGAPAVGLHDSGPARDTVRLSGSVGIAAVPADAVSEPLRTGLAAAAADAAQDAAAGSTDLAVAVFDRGTGETASGGAGDEPYYTASLSKVVVAVDVLDRRRTDGLAVSDADLDLFRRALGPSDDSAMNTLWTRFDGRHAAGRVSAALGLTATTDPRDPSQWGEMSVSAADMVRLWRHILDEMPTADRDLLIGDMAAAPATARDGFDQAFGLLQPDVDGPDGTGAVAKQGWLCCIGGRYYLHSVGVVGTDQRFVVAVLTRVPRGPGWEAARQEIDRIVEGAVAELG